MAKRGNGEGTIRRRTDGRWEARLQGADGKRKSLYAETRGELVARLRPLQRDRDLGLPTRSDRLTTGEFLAKWIEGARANVRPTTALRYQGLIRRHLIPRLGRIPLTRLAPHDLASCYAAMTDDGLAPRTAGHAHRVLGRALRDAEGSGLVGRNVARLVTAPRVPHQEMKALDADQAHRLLRAAAGDRLEALYLLALSTGAREGELLALRWSDLDLDSGVVRIRRTLLRTPSGLSFAEPKTATSRRSIPIGRSTVEALRAHRQRQAEERLGELVFANTMGGPINAGELLRSSFYPLLRTAGLPRVRFHDLRHTAATLMLTQGVHPKIVAERLGHSTPMLTLTVYSHVTPTMQRAAADGLDAVLAGRA
jgi:integrase